MPPQRLLLVAAHAALAAAALLAAVPAVQAQEPGRHSLVPFESDEELTTFLRATALAELRRRSLHPASMPCTGPVSVSVDSVATGDGPAIVRGVVRSALVLGPSNGLAGANVFITRLSLSVGTQPDGAFQLDIPAPSLGVADTVTVRVRSVGFRPVAKTVVVGRGSQVRLDAALCPDVTRLSEVTVTGVATGADESVTNVQHEGIDEGGIVKRHGDHLVILRRGRLFTVDVREGRLRPVAAVDASGPDIDPSGTWYDELLVARDRVIVVGYSYARGGTELGVFRITPSGGLRHQGTYHLRSYDYYSSRNYASRLVGDRLVFYAPLPVVADTVDPLRMLPAMRRWRPGEGPTGTHGEGGFARTAAAVRVHRPAGRVEPADVRALHAVTSCDLSAPELTCESTVVLGADSRVFYVSPSAVYVAAAEWQPDGPGQRPGPNPTMLYRLPHDGGAPTALGIEGSPIDQFSFLERSGHLNVLLRAEGSGDGMWRAERADGRLALLRIALDRFGDGAPAPPDAYWVLPQADEDLSLQNRFVGDHLLYGAGNSWGALRAVTPTLVVVPVLGGEVARLSMPHGVDRIDVLGRDAVVVGSDTADLHFTAVTLGAAPALAHRFVLPQASQGETRSHGFFYRPDPGTTGSGTLGLPVARPGRPGFEQLFEESASVLFLRNERGRFRRLGELEARPERAVDDGCRASCVDWYGNARPLFVGHRVFALLGYELVEGRMRAGRIVELRRASFAPRRASGAGSGS